MQKKIFDTAETLSKDFAKVFAEICNKNKAQIHIALSGGSTPKLLFKELAANYKDKINWSKVHLWWGDERCVPPTHEESNYKMTNDLLISQINIPSENIHRIKGESDPVLESITYADKIKASVPMSKNTPHFDLVMLGMGDDGHTLSIFPHELHLLTSKRIADVAIHPVSGQKRISLTGEVANTAEEIFFLVTGDNKKEKIDDIFHKKGDWLNYPAAHIIPTNGNLTWYIDKSAAALL